MPGSGRMKNKVEHTFSAPQRLPDWNKNAAGIRAFFFKDPDGHPLESNANRGWVRLVAARDLS